MVKSHIDGSKHFFPETAVEIQRKIGANIIMAFDSVHLIHVIILTNKSMKLTHNWLNRCIKTFK